MTGSVKHFASYCYNTGRFRLKTEEKQLGHFKYAKMFYRLFESFVTNTHPASSTKFRFFVHKAFFKKVDCKRFQLCTKSIHDEGNYILSYDAE